MKQADTLKRQSEDRTSASSVFLTRSGFGIRRGVTLANLLMNKPLIISIAIIAFLGAVVLSTRKPILIHIHQHKYLRASEQLASTADITTIHESIKALEKALRALDELGYIELYTIQIKNPATNTQAIIDAVSSYSLFKGKVINISLSTNDDGKTSMTIIDKAGSRHFWESFVREHLEMESRGQP